MEMSMSSVPFDNRGTNLILNWLQITSLRGSCPGCIVDRPRVFSRSIIGKIVMEECKARLWIYSEFTPSIPDL